MQIPHFSKDVKLAAIVRALKEKITPEKVEDTIRRESRRTGFGAVDTCALRFGIVVDRNHEPDILADAAFSVKDDGV